MTPRHIARPLLAALVLSAATAGAAGAQNYNPPHGKPDFTLAPAGAYALDPTHTAVVARLRHLDYSISVFRFDKATGNLSWDPAAPAKSALTVSVQADSVATPVAGFGQEIAGKFLKAGQFPQITFVSSSFRQTDATHGKVDGQFSLLGKTLPLTFDVELIGAGPGFGSPRMGVEATAVIKPEDFGLTLMGGPVNLVIDTEFVRGN